jgi:hypothetical protein
MLPEREVNGNSPELPVGGPSSIPAAETVTVLRDQRE